MNIRRDIFCRSGSNDSDCSNCAMRRVSVCSYLSKEALERLHRAARFDHYPKGRVIVAQGQTLDQIYFIADGFVSLHRDQADGDHVITGFLGPGDLFSGIKNRNGAYCTARALSDVRTCGFERQEFVDLMHNCADIGYGMLLTATDEIEALTDHVMLMTRKSAMARVAAFLVLFSSKWSGEENTLPGEFSLPVPRAAIAAYLGLAVETVSRVFTELKNDGLIATPSRDKIIFKQPAALYYLSKLDHDLVARTGLGL
jgi:CRP/FNR family transcriptional regulator